jgi:dihydrofolate reductase
MRHLIVTENITLDGVIDASAGWFAPSGEDDVDQSDLIATITQQREAADAFLVGRVTFEEMRAYWPRQTNDDTGISDYLNAVSKYVVSSSLGDPEWDRTTVLSGDVRAEVQTLKAQPGKDIVCTGSITLVHELLTSGLVDEFRLFVYPVALGEGRRLFEEVPGILRLELVENTSFRSGIVLLRYRKT